MAIIHSKEIQFRKSSNCIYHMIQPRTWCPQSHYKKEINTSLTQIRHRNIGRLRILEGSEVEKVCFGSEEKDSRGY